jgi:hypothetical protein
VIGKTVGVLTYVLGFLVATEIKCIITLEGNRAILSAISTVFSLEDKGEEKLLTVSAESKSY